MLLLRILHFESRIPLHTVCIPDVFVSYPCTGDWILMSLGTHYLRWDPKNLTLSTSFAPLVYLMCKQHESLGAGLMLMDRHPRLRWK